MSKHQMCDFPDTPSSSDIVLEAVIEGLQRVLRHEHTPEQQR